MKLFLRTTLFTVVIPGTFAVLLPILKTACGSLLTEPVLVAYRSPGQKGWDR